MAEKTTTTPTTIKLWWSGPKITRLRLYYHTVNGDYSINRYNVAGVSVTSEEMAAIVEAYHAHQATIKK